MLTSTNEFLLYVLSDIKPSNESILEEIKLLDINDADYAEKLARSLTTLCVVKPLVIKSIKISRSLAWKTYMEDNNVSKNQSTMANVIKLLDKTDINQWIIELYEEDYPGVKDFVHRVNNLSGYNKVPYLHILLKSLAKVILPNKKLNSKEALKLLFSSTELTSQIDSWVNANELKKYSGETVTSPSMYSWLNKNFPLDTKSIADSDIAYDLGGGFATPALSILFNKAMVCLDVNPPTNNANVVINTIKSLTVEEYRDLLAQQAFINFNVFTDEFPLNYTSYFITSFGFATSTVSSPGNETLAGSSWINTTYNCMKRLSNLIAANKEVYFILYGRPTNRVHRNKVIAMKFKNMQLITSEIYKDDYSTKTAYNFGVTQVLN
jgi:hypothetical protein